MERSWVQFLVLEGKKKKFIASKQELQCYQVPERSNRTRTIKEKDELRFIIRESLMTLGSLIKEYNQYSNLEKIITVKDTLPLIPSL